MEFISGIFEIFSKIWRFKSYIFEIFSKTWSPTPGFLKYFQKYGGSNLGFFKYLQKHGVQIRDFRNIFKNMEVQILDFWYMFKNMTSKSLTSTQIQDWDQSMVFEMVYLLVQQVFEKTIILRGTQIPIHPPPSFGLTMWDLSQVGTK